MAMDVEKILENKAIEQMYRADEKPANNQIQQKVLESAIKGETSPQQQAMQLLITAPNLNQTQQNAQQQIKQGFLDIKI